jgi:hypothetical protein
MNARIQEILANLGNVEQWIDNSTLLDGYSAAYWNDASREQYKDSFWIADGDHGKCLDCLASSGLMQEYAVALDYIQ